jgi:hypothetical protein
LNWEEKKVSSMKAPLLSIWEAMCLIEKAHECSNIADLPEILAEAEIVLSNVLKDLAQNAKLHSDEIGTQSANDALQNSDTRAAADRTGLGAAGTKLSQS